MMIEHDFSLWLTVYMVWNMIGFFMIMVDKRRARRDEWRIRERTFFIWALSFGAVGILLGMYIFHHKTRHWSFVIGMPILCLLNLGCWYLLWR